jgi:hypothetical protein
LAKFWQNKEISNKKPPNLEIAKPAFIYVNVNNIYILIGKVTYMPPLSSWFTGTVTWLDRRGKAAWLIVMILSFIFVWPIGLAILFYMIWSNRMSRSFFGCCQSRKQHITTGNTAFDAYKEDTLKRLEDEQSAFQGFLQRLREAKDKTEFDDFMNGREKELKQQQAQA